jgi:hypothetical protein
MVHDGPLIFIFSFSISTIGWKRYIEIMIDFQHWIKCIFIFFSPLSHQGQRLYPLFSYCPPLILLDLSFSTISPKLLMYRKKINIFLCRN